MWGMWIRGFDSLNAAPILLRAKSVYDFLTQNFHLNTIKNITINGKGS